MTWLIDSNKVKTTRRVLSVQRHLLSCIRTPKSASSETDGASVWNKSLIKLSAPTLVLLFFPVTIMLKQLHAQKVEFCIFKYFQRILFQFPSAGRQYFSNLSVRYEYVSGVQRAATTNASVHSQHGESRAESTSRRSLFARRKSERSTSIHDGSLNT